MHFPRLLLLTFGIFLAGCMAESSEVGYLTSSSERWTGQQTVVTSHSMGNRTILIRETPHSRRLREQEINDQAQQAYDNIFGDDSTEPTTSWNSNDGRPSYIAFDACHSDNGRRNNVTAVPSGPGRGDGAENKIWWRFSSNESTPIVDQDGNEQRMVTHGDFRPTNAATMADLASKMLRLFEGGSFGC